MAAMDEVSSNKKARYRIPGWFPRNPVLHGEEEEHETTTQWNKYLMIPKGDPRRRAFTDALKQRYLESYQPIYGAQGEPTPSPSLPQEEEPEELPAEKPFPPTNKRPLAVDQAPTHYTPKQVEIAKFVAMSMELLARSNDCSILDMRKAYEYWLQGRVSKH